MHNFDTLLKLNMEPWLESLSDDWNPEPAPTATSPLQSIAPSSAAPRSRTSRIPRYVSPQKLKKPTYAPEAPTEPVPLQDTSTSKINIDIQNYSSAQTEQQEANCGLQLSNPATLSSLPSVIRHSNSIAEHGKGQAIENEGNPQTPDWKHLALCEQDLFSPAGLENIFQKPRRDVESSPLKSSFSFDQDLSYYPSSPPPWPSPAQPSSGSGLYASRSALVTNLEPLQEQEEEEEGNIIPNNRKNMGTQSNTGIDTALPLNSDGIIQSDQELQELDNDHETVSGCRSKILGSRSSSSLTDGFSPVFVSKHNTVDGRVKYAAFDPAHLPKLSEHVNLERGGYSDDGSFKKKPLSSEGTASALPSDSIAPSDSISQVRKLSSQPSLQTTKSTTLEKLPEKLQSPQAQFCAENEVRSDEGTVERHLSNGEQAESADGSATLQSLRTVIEHQPQPQPQPHLKQPDLSASEGHRDAGVGETLCSSYRSKDVEPLHLVKTGAEDRLQVDDPLTRHRSREYSEYTDTHVPDLRPPSVAGKKRKDARYESTRTPTDALTIANREILRPRNPTPWQGQRDRGRPTSVSDGIGSPISASEEQSFFLHEPIGTPKARALASEAATFRVRNNRSRYPGDRKKSVSTQDYLNEAMRIMDLIRTRKKAATSDWSSNTGLDVEAWSVGGGDGEATAQTISRPPSRDGPTTGWRSQASKQVDPTVEKHLRRYEETGDESFLVSSIVRSVRIAEEREYQHEMDGIRIIDNPNRKGLRRRSNPGDTARVDVTGNLNTTQSSNGDTEGSEETQKTSSTQKMSSLGRIAPEQISHLIGEEEAGMRFDTQRQTWVKCKSSRPKSGSQGIAASCATTDDDPLAQIPDLSINEKIEQSPANTSNEKIFGQPANFDPSGFQRASQSQKDPHTFSKANSSCLPLAAEQDDHDVLEPTLPDIPVSVHLDDPGDVEPSMTNIHSGNSCRVPSNSHLQSIEQAELDDMPGELARRVSPVHENRKRRDQSVLFSSPPVSRAWEAQQWTDSSDTREGVRHGQIECEDHESSQMVTWKYPAGGDSPRRRNSRQHWSRNVSLSHTEQHQEISFVEHRPDGRTFSLSMSVSTPGPVCRRNNGTSVPPSALRQSSFLQSLSPLSDFSVSNKDEHHIRENALTRPVEIVQHRGDLRMRTASTTDNLVGKLTDTEPDEPYWDFMHRLNLAQKNLDTIHMLDEFCPRLEELDVSNNSLRQVNGAPVSLRHLNLSCNQLTGLTDLSYLRNLQYVNLASNGLTNLEGFSNLIHLRDINADSNNITNIDGILDLDGLLSISLKKNKLKSIDFGSAQLRRLSHVNLDGNEINSLLGLRSLPMLSDLSLSFNALTSWPTDACCESNSLQNLYLDNNQLSSVDISQILCLRSLSANNNSLSSIEGIETHGTIQRLYLSNQSATITTLDPFANLTTLHLSGTPLLALLPLTKPALDLRIIDLSFTGLQALPGDFGTLCPNLQTLNLNSNNLRDLRPLDGIVALRRLHVARNRIARLRKFVRVLGALGGLVKGRGMLEEVDVRGNPLSNGFYYGEAEANTVSVPIDDRHSKSEALGLLGAQQDPVTDAKYLGRADPETQLRRRVYEMLVSSKCPKLRVLDGLVFERDRIEKSDEVWQKLVAMGVVQQVG